MGCSIMGEEDPTFANDFRDEKMWPSRKESSYRTESKAQMFDRIIDIKIDDVEEKVMTFEDFEIMKTIGRGAFGKVYQARLK